MRKLTSVEELESVIGTRPLAVMMKSVDELDEGSQTVLAHSPVAAMGYHDRNGRLRATFVGGAPGFAQIDSPTRISIALPANEPRPDCASASLIFFVPGVGETLRVAGLVAESSAERTTIDLREAWVHCAKCVLRSKLWEGAPEQVSGEASGSASASGSSEPLTEPGVAEFLSAATFVVLSSQDASGASDTSPKGDPPGFLHVLDGRRLIIPDRKGNRRTDTFHNLLDRDEIALAALVPGRGDVLHASGTGYVTDDADLLSTMALGGKPPHAALVVTVDDIEITDNEPIVASAIWDPSRRADPSELPDLMQLGAHHIARNKARGAKAAAVRGLSRGLAASPRLLRRGVDHGYQKELRDEGYGDDTPA